ncbi:MAG: AbrB family transcriptional regulator [Rhizonema sp. PD37]|nr:AbrB family transcriptional regulator [Rhizonema sp. PD37]
MNQILSTAIQEKADNNEQRAVAELKPLIILGLEMFLALPLGLLLSQLHIGGVTWLFGGIMSGAIILQSYRIFYKHCLLPNRSVRKIGMALVGLNVGFSVARGNLASVASSAPVFIFLTFFILICGTIIGYIYSRLIKTNLLTAMLATVPGGVGLMSAIAADYGRDVTLVALVQALRVTTVVLLIPSIARVSTGTYINLQTSHIQDTLLSLAPSQFGFLLLALVLGGLGAYLAGRAKIPAGDFFGALIVGIAFNPVVNWLPVPGDVNFIPPPLINLIGQMLLGITIGEYWGKKPTFRGQTIAYTLMSVALTLVAGAIAAVLAMQLTSWDWLTCMLVTAPGGSAEMILVALALDHNVEIVTAGHLMRLIAINSSLPLWVFLFRRLEENEKLKKLELDAISFSKES